MAKCFEGFPGVLYLEHTVGNFDGVGGTQCAMTGVEFAIGVLVPVRTFCSFKYSLL